MLFFHFDTAQTDDTDASLSFSLKLCYTVVVCVIDACQDCQTVWAINQSTACAVLCLPYQRRCCCNNVILNADVAFLDLVAQFSLLASCFKVSKARILPSLLFFPWPSLTGHSYFFEHSFIHVLGIDGSSTGVRG